MILRVVKGRIPVGQLEAVRRDLERHYVPAADACAGLERYVVAIRPSADGHDIALVTVWTDVEFGAHRLRGGSRQIRHARREGPRRDPRPRRLLRGRCRRGSAATRDAPVPAPVGRVGRAGPRRGHPARSARAARRARAGGGRRLRRSPGERCPGRDRVRVGVVRAAGRRLARGADLATPVGVLRHVRDPCPRRDPARNATSLKAERRPDMTGCREPAGTFGERASN